MASMILLRSWPARPTKGRPGSVLVRARRLADEHQARGRLAFGVDDLRASLMERAADALAHVFAYVLEGLAGDAEAQLVLRRDVAEQRLARLGRVGGWCTDRFLGHRCLVESWSAPRPREAARRWVVFEGGGSTRVCEGGVAAGIFGNGAIVGFGGGAAAGIFGRGGAGRSARALRSSAGGSGARRSACARDRRAAFRRIIDRRRLEPFEHFDAKLAQVRGRLRHVRRQRPQFVSQVLLIFHRSVKALSHEAGAEFKGRGGGARSRR